ncbi:hypothetical protein [Streptomyces sp. NPDC086010]|uniref:hypothetical protein n=1 Tax=Streptomyces sp. NPDC086010 TaxID=3365745 RepID=UPI0037CEA614
MTVQVDLSAAGRPVRSDRAVTSEMPASAGPASTCGSGGSKAASASAVSRSRVGSAVSW